jgi:hypothetical protein
VRGGGAGGRYADLRLRHVATCCGIRVRRNSKARRGRSALAPQMQSLVMVAFVGAIVACVAYARAIALQLRAQHAPYVAEGAAVICALAAAFVAFAAVDSHLFFSVEGAQKVELQADRDAAIHSRLPASAHCERGVAFLLASYQDPEHESLLTIRCPKTFVLGAGAAKPFLPWPSYDQVTVVSSKP